MQNILKHKRELNKPLKIYGFFFFWTYRLVIHDQELVMDSLPQKCSQNELHPNLIPQQD